MTVASRDLGAELSALASTDAKVLVDFDHTLFACNSTELFIATCRPAFLVALVDALVVHLPWRLLGPRWFRARDLARCLAVIVACPWSLPLWRRAAPALMRRHASAAVCAALAPFDPSRVAIVTFGIGAVVRPLLRGSAWQGSALLATPLLPRPRSLRQGKLPLALAAFSPQVVSSCAFVTDSLDDADLLEAAGHGLLVAPQGEAFSARERLYLPLRYMARAKYSPSYLVDQLFLVDVALLVLCGAGLPGSLGWRALSVACLAVSVTCIYEIGYHENDMVAAQGEAAPTLGSRVPRFRSYPIQPAAWLWSLAAAAAGLALGVRGGVIVAWPLAAAVPAWLGCLVVLRLAFRAYNRATMRGRVVLYPFLQVMKYLPVLALVHASVLGAVLVACQVATMWVTYVIYRLGGDKGAFRREEFRTILFAAAAGLLLAGVPAAEPGGWLPAGLMLAWSAARLGKAGALERLRALRRARPWASRALPADAALPDAGD